MALAGFVLAFSIAMIFGELLETFDEFMTLVFIFTVWGGLGGAAIISVFGRGFPFWKNRNDAVAAEAKARRIERLGYDPLAELPKSMWKGGSFLAAVRAQKIIDSAVEHHPSPEELFELAEPVPIRESDVYRDELRPVLRSIVQRSR